MACFDGRVEKINKFPMRCEISVHYSDGRTVVATIGDHAAVVDRVHYNLPADMIPLLRKEFPNDK
jgi:hypothetical protein